jgi:RNA polymerase sigma-70 factor, ECF subfamily
LTNDPDRPATLLARLQRRDEAAFNELVRAHQGSVYRLVLRLLGDEAEAEDVAQEVFVSAFKAIGDFRGDSALGTWLHRIAYNHSLNRIKYRARRAREARSPLDEEIAAQAGTGLGAAPVTPDEVVEGREAEAQVQRALAMLEEEQRALISLRDLDNMSYAEIGERTGLPIGTIKSKLHRARLALHQHFAKLREQP